MSHGYSDLQVVPEQSSLEPALAEKQLATHQSTEKAARYIPEYQNIGFSNRHICGLRRRTFWIVLAAASVIVIGAAVGGGVGGALSNRSSASATASVSTTTSSALAPASSGDSPSYLSTTPTTTMPPSQSITTTTLANPTETLLRDCPSSNNSIYDVTFGADQLRFRKMCSVKLAGGGNNVVNTPTTSLDHCIDLCAAYNNANRTEIASGSSRACNTVCWRNSLSSDWPGQCFGFQTLNSSTGGFSIDTEGTECDSAGWINQEIL